MKYFWWILSLSPLIAALAIAIVEFWDEIKQIVKKKLLGD